MISQLGLHCTINSHYEYKRIEKNNLIWYAETSMTLQLLCLRKFKPPHSLMLCSHLYSSWSRESHLGQELPSLDLCFQTSPHPSNLGVSNSRLASARYGPVTLCHNSDTGGNTQESRIIRQVNSITSCRVESIFVQRDDPIYSCAR